MKKSTIELPQTSEVRHEAIAATHLLGGVIRPAREMNININDKVKIGGSTMFNVGGEMLAVEIIDIYGCRLKVMSCDLERVGECQFTNMAETGRIYEADTLMPPNVEAFVFVAEFEIRLADTNAE